MHYICNPRSTRETGLQNVAFVAIDKSSRRDCSETSRILAKIGLITYDQNSGWIGDWGTAPQDDEQPDGTSTNHQDTYLGEERDNQPPTK